MLKGEDITNDIIMLNEISNVIAGNKACFDIDTIFQEIVNKIVEVMNIPLCTIRMLDEGNMLRLKYAAGSTVDRQYDECIGADGRDMSKALKDNRIIVIKNSEGCRIAQHSKDMWDDRIKSLAFIPLKLDKKPVGIMTIGDSGKFAEERLDTFGSLSNLVSGALEKAMLYDQIRDLYMKSVKSLVTAIEAKDIFTQSHSIRVSQYSVNIARKLGLSKQEIKEVEITGILHDIGKIGVKDMVLTKPDRLDEVEFQIIQQHPLIGSKILEPMGFSQNIIFGTLLHHKRYDLKGYPEEVELKELPLVSRIIGAADAFDAMTSARPYKSPMPREVAMAEMKRNAGTQFCPEIVNIMEKLYEENTL